MYGTKHCLQNIVYDEGIETLFMTKGSSSRVGCKQLDEYMSDSSCRVQAAVGDKSHSRYKYMSDSSCRVQMMFF